MFKGGSAHLLDSESLLALRGRKFMTMILLSRGSGKGEIGPPPANPSSASEMIPGTVITLGRLRGVCGKFNMSFEAKSSRLMQDLENIIVDIVLG